MTRLRRQYYRQARFSEGTAAQWTAENPVLYLGEPGFESDTRKMKVGNGVQAWNDLLYFGGGGGVDDHGDLDGLSDDDHPQYLTEAEGDAAYSDITEPIAAAHVIDAAAAHAASAISADSGTLVGTGTDVQAVLEELDNAIVAAEGALTTHAGAADPHTGYRLESADHSHATTGLQAGNIAATAVTVDSTNLDGTATTVQAVFEELETQVQLAASTHAGAADPHTGYRLESADHTHQSTGAQAGQLTVAALSDAPAGELGGTWASPTVDATHSGSTHSAATDTHIADAGDAHDASAISFDPTGLTTITGDDVQEALEEIDAAIDSIVGASGAPSDADYLVGTTNAGLSNEIVVGATPGGELGGTWASPTVDATHSGSTHSAAVDTHIADVTDVHDHGSLAGLTDDDHTQYLKETDFDDIDFLVGTATGHTGVEIVVGTSPGGELGGTWASPTVDASHAGGTHLVFDDSGAPAAVSTAAADGTASEPSRKDHVHPHETAHVAHDTVWAAANDYVRGTGNDTGTAQTASAATPAAVSTSGATGTAANPPSADDHVHAHEAAHINHDTTWAALGDLIVGTANDTAAVLSKGTQGQGLVVDTAEATDLKWVTNTITVGMLIDGGGSAISTGDYTVWRVPYACTVTAVRGYVDTGTTTVINAGKALSGTYFCSANITIDPADAWEAGTVDQNATLAAGDTVYFDVITAGTATQLTIQVELARA